MTEASAEQYHFLVHLIFGESYNFDAPPTLNDPQALIEILESILDTFSNAESSFLKSRFGLIDGELKTLEEMATSLEKTVDELQALEVELMRKLRNPARSQFLRKYLE